MSRSAVVRAAIYTGTAAGVFWLPFHVPSITTVYSVSQAFHFSNQAAVLALLTGLAAATLWSWLGPRAAAAAIADPPLEDDPLAWWPLLIACAVTSVELKKNYIYIGWVCFCWV